MNPGVFSLVGSGGGGSTNFGKLIGQSGRSAGAPSTGMYVTNANILGITPSITSPASGVRTKAVSISGRGLLHFVAVADIGTDPNLMLVEVFIDGMLIRSVTWTHNGVGIYGAPIIGSCGSSTVPMGVFEDLPFSSSVEVFVTRTGTLQYMYVYHFADLYQ